jgi:serine/threonine protein kinase
MIREIDESGDPVQFPVTFGQYSYLKTIGRGATGVVILVLHRETGRHYACKVISHQKLKDPKMLHQFTQELEVLRLVHHPHIVEQREAFNFDGHCHIVMEYARGGELVSYLSNFEATDPAIRRRIFVQLCSALSYLHSNGIVHRDLKPHNILLDENLNVKLGDFGFGRRAAPDALLVTPCGSPDYVAPEVLLGQPYDGMKADIWSLGVVLFVLETGRIPWTATNNVVLFDQISNALYEVPVTIDEDLANLITECLNPDPHRRPSASELLAVLNGRPQGMSLARAPATYGQALGLSVPRRISRPRMSSTRSLVFPPQRSSAIVIPTPEGRRADAPRLSSLSGVIVQPLPPKFRPCRSGQF